MPVLRHALRIMLPLCAVSLGAACSAGSVSTWGPDAASPDGAAEDVSVDDGGDGGAPPDCGVILCPPGTECVDSTCRPIDPCRDVFCDEPEEVCSAGRCVAAGSDGDGDGFTADEDCDDGDPDVWPGTTQSCVTGCGEGLSTCGDDGEWGECVLADGACDLSHARGACVDGSCIIVACDDGWSNCDDAHDNGCESEGGCGSPGLACGDVLDCCLACADVVCLGMCALQACPASTGPVSAFVVCADAQCDPSCDVPSSGACADCLVAQCSAQRAACLAAGC